MLCSGEAVADWKGLARIGASWYGAIGYCLAVELGQGVFGHVTERQGSCVKV